MPLWVKGLLMTVGGTVLVPVSCLGMCGSGNQAIAQVMFLPLLAGLFLMAIGFITFVVGIFVGLANAFRKE